MSNQNNGGPAFPGHSSVAGGANSGMYGGGFVASQGMTLRDYFAAKAMQAMISNSSIIDGDSEGAISFASNAAYHFADAMLRVREDS